MSNTIGDASVRVRADTKNFAAETKSGILGPIKDIAKLAAGAIAIKGGVDFFADSVKGALDYQERLSAIKQTLKSSGQGTDLAAKKAENYTAALSKLSGFTKTEVAGALQRADQGTQNLGKAMQVETIAANLARSRHADLAQTTLLVTKAFDGNTTGLKRLGISFSPVTAATDALKEKIRDLTAKSKLDTGATKARDQAQIASLRGQADAAKAADKTATGLAVQAKLAKIAQGGLAAFGETTAGKIAKAKNAIDDLQIEIGTALLPIIGKLADKGTEYLEKLQKKWPEIRAEAVKVFDGVKPIFDTIEGVIQTLIGTLGGAHQALKDIAIAVVAYIAISKTITVLTAVYEGLTTAIFLARNAQIALDVAMETNPVGIVVVALAALAAGIYLAYTRSATFRAIVQDAFAVLRTDVLPILKEVAGAIVTFITGVRNHWGQITAIIGPPIKAVFALIKGYVQAPLDEIKGAINLFGDVIHGRWSNIWNDLKALVTKPLADLKNAVLNALGDLAPLASAAAKVVAHLIADGIKAAPGFLVGLAGDLLGKIKDAVSQIASDAYSYGEKVGTQIALGVVHGLAGLPGKIAGAVGLGGATGLTDKINAAKKAAAANAKGSGSTSSFEPGQGQGTVLAYLASATVPDGDYAHGMLQRKGGKWYLSPREGLALPLPLKSDISAVVEKWVGSGISPAAGKQVEDWWRQHFTGKKVVAGSGTTLDFQGAGRQLGSTLIYAIAGGATTLGSKLASSLRAQVTASVVAAKQNLVGLTGSLAADIGQVIDAGTTAAIALIPQKLTAAIGGVAAGSTLSAASAKIAKDQVDRQKRSLQDALDTATTAATAGPVAGSNTTQAQLNQAKMDAQTDLDDFLLQQQIDLDTATYNSAVKAAQDQATLSKANVNRQISDWTYQYNAGLISQSDYLADLNGQVAAYSTGDGAVTWASAGELLGVAFAAQFSTHLDDIKSQIDQIATAGSAGIGGAGISGNVVKPSDAIVQNLIDAHSSALNDADTITTAAAALKKAQLKEKAVTFDPTTHTGGGTPAQQAAAAAALKTAQKQYDAAIAAEKRDNTLIAALNAILQKVGIDPDTVIAAAVASGGR